MLRSSTEAGFAVSRGEGAARSRPRSRRPATARRRRARSRSPSPPPFSPSWGPGRGRGRRVCRRRSIGGELFRNILEAVPGPAHPVNRSGAAVAGAKARRSIARSPSRRPRGLLPSRRGVLAAPRRRSARRAGAVRDLGRVRRDRAEGAARQDQLLALVRSHGGRLVGPNCLGSPAPVRLNATFAATHPPGNVGFTSQSGALGLAILAEAPSAAWVSRRSSRSATRPTSPATTCSSTGRTTPRASRPALPRVLRQSAPLPPVARRVARAKPISRSRAASRARARAAPPTPARSPAPTPPSTRCSSRPASSRSTLEELLDPAELLANQPLPRGLAGRYADQRGRPRDPLHRRLHRPRVGAPELAPSRESAFAAVVPAEASVANPVDLLASARVGHERRSRLLDGTGVDAVSCSSSARMATRGGRCPRRPARGRPGTVATRCPGSS